MASEAQTAANQANAALSTGPRTPNGKARVSRNAVKHGLYSQAPLDGEDARAYEERMQRLVEALRPGDELEEALASRFAWAFCRLHRIGQMERAFVQVGRDVTAYKANGTKVPEGPLPWDIVFNGLLMLGQEPGGDRTAPFDRLRRYEAHLERVMYRALHELQRLQAVRAGQDVLAPIAVDVDVPVGGS